MKVSVIIPIYNTGEYLRRCIGSICRQTYRDLQIIMIDDGSEKETASICDEIAASDSRIQLIHKINEGVSKARNTGLDLACGEVVCFVDSDDTIAPDMIEVLVSTMLRDKSEIVMCDAVTITPGKPDEADTIPDFETSCIIDVGNIQPSTLTRIAGSACRCAYRRKDILLAKSLRFPEGLKFSEDRIFNIIAMSAARRISYLKKPFYNRLIREGSACFRYYPDMTEQIVKMRKEILLAVRNNWGEHFIEAYERQVCGHIHYAISNFTTTPNRTSLKKLRELCDDKSIRECIASVQKSDIRSRLILKRQAFSLLIIGILTNIYHRIC